ncbi:MAG TPA: hypothetical protein VFB79_19575 [Candidatus Angelobacter sp.]|nr:hypothetical protein [Candidatus Angelobacter sp.]
MKPLYKGLAITLIHILIVLTLGGKLLYDRSYRPRVWVRAGQVDPDLPIRGRYLALNLEVHTPDLKGSAAGRENPSVKPEEFTQNYIELTVENNTLVAHKTERPSNLFVTLWRRPFDYGDDVYFLSPPVLFFLPEHAELPQLNRETKDELWAEVTVPKKGPPRPIQLAIKRGDEWKPLTYR